MSARFDGTLEPIVDPDAADADPLEAAAALDLLAAQPEATPAPAPDVAAPASLDGLQTDDDLSDHHGDLAAPSVGLDPSDVEPDISDPEAPETLPGLEAPADDAAVELPSPDAVDLVMVEVDSEGVVAVEADPVEVAVVDADLGDVVVVEADAGDIVVVEADPGADATATAVDDVPVEEVAVENVAVDEIAVDDIAVDDIAVDQIASGEIAAEHAVVDDDPDAEVPEVVGDTEMVLSMAAERLATPSDIDVDRDGAPVADDGIDIGERIEIDEIDLPAVQAGDAVETVGDEGVHHDSKQPDHHGDHDGVGTAAVISGVEAMPPPVDVAPVAGDDVDLAEPYIDDPVFAEPAFGGAEHADGADGVPYFDPSYAGRTGSDSLDHHHDDHDDQMVRGGPRWYRKRISQFGIVLGLVPMVLLGGAATLIMAVGSGPLSGQLGLLLGTSAAPGLLVAGAPFASSDTYPFAAVGSIPLWLVLGWLARRRTLARPIAGWRDYAIQLGWLTLAVIVGAGIALAFSAIRIGGPLLG